MFSMQIYLSNIKLCLATSALLFLGCSSDGAPKQETLGNVEMKLVGQAASGNTYRLRDGHLWVEDSETSVFFNTESDPDLSSLSATVPAGYYFSYLEPGWSLERVYPNGTSEFVEAMLLSPNPDEFAVNPNENTQIALRFRAGEDEVSMNDGSFDIVLDVEEAGSPLSACAVSEIGEWRDCDWSLAPGFVGASCTPGETTVVGCGCSGGVCGGDPIIRVCEGSEACLADAALASGDQECGSCPEAAFTCPTSGLYTVMVGGWVPWSWWVCEPVSDQ